MFVVANQTIKTKSTDRQEHSGNFSNSREKVRGDYQNQQFSLRGTVNYTEKELNRDRIKTFQISQAHRSVVGWVSFLLFLFLVEFFPIELLGSTDSWVLETVGRWSGLRGGQHLLVLLWVLEVSLRGAEVPQELGRWGARLGQLLDLSCSQLLEEDT